MPHANAPQDALHVTNYAANASEFLKCQAWVRRPAVLSNGAAPDAIAKGKVSVFALMLSDLMSPQGQQS